METTAEPTYAVNLDEHEITLLMQLLNQRIVAIQLGQQLDYVEFSTAVESGLLQRLASIRENAIKTARAAGPLR